MVMPEVESASQLCLHTSSCRQLTDEDGSIHVAAQTFSDPLPKHPRQRLRCIRAVHRMMVDILKERTDWENDLKRWSECPLDRTEAGKRDRRHAHDAQGNHDGPPPDRLPVRRLSSKTQAEKVRWETQQERDARCLTPLSRLLMAYPRYPSIRSGAVGFKLNIPPLDKLHLPKWRWGEESLAHLHQYVSERVWHVGIGGVSWKEIALDFFFSFGYLLCAYQRKARNSAEFVKAPIKHFSDAGMQHALSWRALCADELDRVSPTTPVWSMHAVGLTRASGLAVRPELSFQLEILRELIQVSSRPGSGELMGANWMPDILMGGEAAPRTASTDFVLIRCRRRGSSLRQEDRQRQCQGSRRLLV